MRLRSPALALILSSCAYPSIVCAEQQQPFILNHEFPVREDPFYEFRWPVHKVGIIGAGVGGLITYRTLAQAGYDVRLYERDHHPGGVWHYTEETPLNAPIPNLPVVNADYTPSLPPNGTRLPHEEEHFQVDENWLTAERKAHRLPKPVWASLKSNAPHIPELHWPEDLPWEISAKQLQSYVRAFASYHSLNTNDENPNVFYNTRVELIEKRFIDGRHHGWTMTLKEFIQTGPQSYKVKWWTEDFDAIAIATGRYNSPSVSPITGLAEWNDKFPENIHHSRQYRRPEGFTNKTVLIIGAASSGAEIAAELNTFASKVYLSTRVHPHPHYPLELFIPFIPKNTTMIPEVKSFNPLGTATKMSEGTIELFNGTKIAGIDHVLVCTGFRYTYPFLPQYINPSLRGNETASEGPQPLVTDGSHVRSLHLDLFYIEEPTLAFININGGMQSFVYAEYLAAAAASVWKGHAKLPTQNEMWRTYSQRLRDFGGIFEKHWLFLGSGAADGEMRYFVAWVNEAAVRYGGKQINGPSKA
ncbi:FAD/NAD(P)-binding domain-containing protein [Dendrothele bispora CBS 962.96]|uniref:FAD/NAD(P)-binding domain-containing protein n=1 Tax=Dendrothele bispora (strain CBS 962.96) TaxID=1314807 RepID=A0A4S8MYJ1_DENBC|nr:FAD/NAD(P)-binding domain-containing protein [Dendrothele bispora CBS 962.96]